jgi:hypothetical protein
MRVFSDAEYEFHVEFPKFKIADLIWRIDDDPVFSGRIPINLLELYVQVFQVPTTNYSPIEVLASTEYEFNVGIMEFEKANPIRQIDCDNSFILVGKYP